MYYVPSTQCLRRLLLACVKMLPSDIELEAVARFELPVSIDGIPLTSSVALVVQEAA